MSSIELSTVLRAVGAYYTEERTYRKFTLRKVNKLVSVAETWDVFKKGQHIGSVKLENGVLKAFATSNVDKGVVYNPNGVNTFNKESERVFYLKEIVEVFKK